MLADSLRRITDRAFAPYSAGAFVFALVCVAVVTAARYALGWLNPSVAPFGAHLPAVLIVAMVAGTPAAVIAALLSIVVAVFLFVPRDIATELLLLNATLFAISSILIILVAEGYRQLVARYRRQERQNSLMVRELEHRGRNTFAVVEAIVSQTLSDDPEIAKVITGRIRAVSSTNDIISHAANLEPDLRTLILAKFEPFGPFRASLDGTPITLPADAARNLSLVFHELVTNAIKHGALSQPNGRIDISWRSDGETLSIKWVERDGPTIAAPVKRGFGTMLVVGCVKNLGGTVEAEFPPSGLVCVISVPQEKTASSNSSSRAATEKSAGMQSTAS